MLEGRHIALIEDDEIMGGSIQQRLVLEGARVQWIKTLHRALAVLASPHHGFDAVVCDIRLPDGTGEELFLALCERGVPAPFLFMTGQGATDQAVRLLRAGAADYLMKPFDMNRLLERLTQIIPPEDVRGPGAWFGVSSAARKLDAEIDRIANRNEPVLIRGESGTGKKLVARRIHVLSDRQSAPFVAVDMTRLAISDQERHLFDPDGGAVVRARDGILLLERIGHATPEVQARLVGILWGHDNPGHLRVLATEAADLPVDKLRPDLFFHLSVLRIDIPAFRARPEDAVWYMSRLLERVKQRHGTSVRGLSPQAEQAVRMHDWPGNGREIRARLIRATAVTDRETIIPADLFPEGVPGLPEGKSEGFMPLGDARDMAERVHIEAALQRTGGSMTEAAKLLQVGRSTLWEKMQKLGIQSRS